jgi:hypothetical protein
MVSTEAKPTTAIRKSITANSCLFILPAPFAAFWNELQTIEFYTRGRLQVKEKQDELLLTKFGICQTGIVGL